MFFRKCTFKAFIKIGSLIHKGFNFSITEGLIANFHKNTRYIVRLFIARQDRYIPLSFYLLLGPPLSRNTLAKHVKTPAPSLLSQHILTRYILSRAIKIPSAKLTLPGNFVVDV